MMTRRDQHERAPARPIWGFGPIGWLALAVLVALLAWVWVEPRPRDVILYWEYRLLGIDAVYWTVTWLISNHYFAAFGAQFGVVGGCLATIGLWVSRRRVGVVGWFVLWLTALAAPPVWVYLLRFLESSGMSTSAPITLAQPILVSAALISMVCFGILWVLSRSLIVLMAGIAATAFPLVFPHFSGPVLTHVFAYGWAEPVQLRPVLWNAIWFLPLLAWAIWHRRQVPAWESGCRSCGYDTTGLSGLCPECGETIENDPSRSPERHAGQRQNAQQAAAGIPAP